MIFLIKGTYLYKKAPILRMSSWNQLAKAIDYFLIKNFLNKKDLLQTYYKNTLMYQEQNYSAIAIADYIINNVNEC